MQPKDILKHLTIRASIKSVDPYSFEKTLTCGQFFRYQYVREGASEDGFIVQAGDRVCGVRQIGSRELEVALPPYSMDTDFDHWVDFFNGEQRTKLLLNWMEQRDPWLKKAAQCADGIRILRQDAWEALITFLISQNNSMIRIKGTVQLMCERLGVRDEIGCYGFPTPEAILYGELNGLGLGYRDGYLKRAAYQVVNNTINLEQLDANHCLLNHALSRLQSMSGVGAKVANCVALYGLGHTDAFPVDVWIKRALSRAKLTVEDAKQLKEDAGLLQQYMFYYITHDGGALA